MLHPLRVLVVSLAKAAVAREVEVPVGGAGGPQAPDVPLPVRGGTAIRSLRIKDRHVGPFPPGCCLDFIEEGARIIEHGSRVLFLSGWC